MTNEELDEKVLGSVREGFSRFEAIWRCVGGGYDGPERRVVDRSLQRLRRAGKVAYTSALGWSVT